MTRLEVPPSGQNELTKRLLAQGVKLDDCKTWPEGVWTCDLNNFAYSREYRFMPTWESPCGLLIHDHGDMWGETWVDGEFKCSENDNPLFGCPTPGKPCPHRLKLPAGINCQFHRTDREWTKAESVEALQEARNQRFHELWEEKIRKYPDWQGYCMNLKTVNDLDGNVRYEARYRVENCIQSHCKSAQCVCRCGAYRNLKPANIFYDLYLERHYTEGLVPYSEATLHKGLKVFDKAVAWTDAEIALKLWQHNPDSHLVPAALQRRLNAGCDREISWEIFFIRHHGTYFERVNCTLTIEVRNIRIARNEGRDLMQDLKDIQDGIKVEHASDMQKAAAAKKSEEREARKIKKYAKRLADGADTAKIRTMKPELREQIVARAAEITAKREAAGNGDEQLSIFDGLEG